MPKIAAEPETGTATVTVALKHPTGIVLEAFREVTQRVPDGRGSLRDETIFKPTGKQYPLHGNAAPQGVRPYWDIIGGYALTPGIPKDVWEMWKAQHSDSELLERNLICAHERLDMVKDEAKDGKALRSGLEPIYPGNDPRTPKRLLPNGKFVDAVETADEQPRAAA